VKEREAPELVKAGAFCVVAANVADLSRKVGGYEFFNRDR